MNQILKKKMHFAYDLEQAAPDRWKSGISRVHMLAKCYFEVAGLTLVEHVRATILGTDGSVIGAILRTDSRITCSIAQRLC